MDIAERRRTQDLSLWQDNFGPEGDHNGDGVVNGADFMTWQQGESPIPLSQSDLADWEANVGAAASLSVKSSQVPEPSSIVLMLGWWSFGSQVVESLCQNSTLRETLHKATLFGTTERSLVR